MPTTPNPFDFTPAPAPSPSPVAPARSRLRSPFDLPLASPAHTPAHAPAPAPAHTPATAALTPAVHAPAHIPAHTPHPAPPLPPDPFAFFSRDERDTLHSLAISSDACHDSPAWANDLWAAVTGKTAGDAYFEGRARLALRYLCLMASGVRSKDAMRRLGIEQFGVISAWRDRSPAFKRMLHEATTRKLAALEHPILDAMADAAIEGDVSIKRNAAGDIISQSKRANPRAAELVLKAADPSRFADHGPVGVGAGGGITYNIGSVTLLAGGQPATGAIPVSPAPALNSGEKRANTIDLEPATAPQLVAPQDFTIDD